MIGPEAYIITVMLVNLSEERDISVMRSTRILLVVHRPNSCSVVFGPVTGSLPICTVNSLLSSSTGTPDKTRITRFLALDKCLPKRDYLQFLDVEPESIIGSSGPLHVKRAPQTQDTGTEQKDEDEPFIVSDKLPSPSPTSHPDKSPRISDEEARSEDGRHESRLDSKRLFLDPEWLCVLRSTNHLMCINKVPCILPGRNVGERCDFSATNAEIRALFEPFGGEFAVPDNFERTAPLYKPNENNDANPVTSTPRGLMAGNKPMQIFSNPQTELMCAMLDLVNPNAVLLGRESYSLSELSSQLEAKKVEETEDDDEEEEEDREAKEQENEDAEPDVVAESVTAAEKTSPDLVEEKPENTDLPADESGWASAEYSRIQKETVEYDPLETTTVSNGAVYPTTLPNPVSSNPEELQLEDSTDEEEYELENNVASDKAVAENPQHSTERYSPQPVGEYFTGPDDSPDSESVGNYGCVGQSGYVPFVPAGKKAPNPEEIVLSTNDEDDVDYTSV
ncbi:unnamed protein product [Calicophoron daubneyi]|uniref:Lariat debranching enzyme C-terminal domain-containing protein n=1 Tax=Calicophoron daubneyi TaxID=300641 RepID=A0AAV2TX30_CALDB